MDQQGDGGGLWTGDRVEARLIAAFRALPDHPVFSSPAGIAPTLGQRPTDTAALNWPARFVTERADRIALLTWARCMAVGKSLSEMCREMGWKRSTVEEARRRASREIASALKV